ncbi:sigma-70 family RNA polymerase sigma factor [Cellulomonas sp.]|uniref:sigma-70 family RNA polymerase sigma factor n=1 Tax=Cellulomonas sp. TaxID=40001 RepID=UPI00258656D3|nr:sigma-70 family RNA polymerase sigma factor [Cellulomonas sp.]MCR6689140.1 sigma-70 family RNA polymerase sigma factor [Cellulomonas sp.]
MPDDDVLTTLARERGRALFGYAYLLTGDRPAAEDLVQEALVRTFARRRTGFTPDDAEAYVRRAILTVYLDDARRRRRWTGVRHLLGRHDEPGGDPAPAVGAVLDVQAALATLAPQERAAAVLRWCEDLTVPEVAARMGLAVGTVKRYLSTAGHKLEARLGPLPEDEPEPITGRSLP